VFQTQAGLFAFIICGIPDSEVPNFPTLYFCALAWLLNSYFSSLEFDGLVAFYIFWPSKRFPAQQTIWSHTITQ